MYGSAKNAVTGAAIPASPAGNRDTEIYDRHAAAVYRQALLMLDDESLAGQVACEVIAAECAASAESPGDPDRVSGRLAVSALRRCQKLIAGRDRVSRRWLARGRSRAQDPDGRERAVLGLVLFGGMEYREAARELAISPSGAAAMLRSALITLAGSPTLPPSAAAR